MRLTTLFLGLLCMHVSAATRSQTVTLNVSQQPITQVLASIEAQTGYLIVYNDRYVKRDVLVSLQVADQPLETVLEQVLSPRALSYQIKGKTIAIRGRRDRRVVGPELLENPVLQQRTVSGKVTDQIGQPMIGVTVSVKGTPTATITADDGSYQLTVAGGGGTVTLTFSFLGHQTVEEQVGNRSSVNVVLVGTQSDLEEVVVVGYGTQRKRDITGSVSSVKAEDISALPSINAMQSLVGRTAGVQVMQNSGAPGAGMNVRIRGGNSIIGGNEPLYVVDGFAISGRPTILDPSDIASMEVLKDASATAIYGSRGANGVVLITTKRGKEGTSQVSYNSYYGVQKVIKTLDVLNARQFAELANERASNDNTTPYFTAEEIAGFGEGTDWQREIFRSAPIQNHSLNFSGGSDKTQYSVSPSYFNQEGILINSGYERGSLRNNISHAVSDKFKIHLTSLLSRTVGNNVRNDNEHRGTGVVSAALVAPPTVPAHAESGGYANVAPYIFSPNVNENPVALANEILNRTTGSGILANLGLGYEIMDGLTFNVTAGIDYANSKTDSYSARIFRNTPAGSAGTSYYTRNNFLNENILNYQNTFGDSFFDVTAGITYQSEKVEGNAMSASGFANDLLLNNNLQSGTVIGTPSASVNAWRLLSGLFRVNYSYLDRYLLTASVRADGSSRFGTSNQWGYFPSAALGWRISEEEFLKDQSWLSNLKLRASIGQTGNTAISPYQSLNVLSGGTVVFGDNLYSGFAPGGVRPNPELKWETTTQTNVGLDVGFLNERLRLVADYYIKNTTDLLANVPTPNSTGYESQIRNIGHIRNTGFEFDLGADLLTGSFSWDVAANFSINRNEVIQLANHADVFGNALTIPLSVSVNLVREGYPVGVFFGYVEDGLNEDGRIKYRDIDENGVINNLDRTIIGDPNPDFIWGFNNNFAYKKISLNVFLQGIQGADLFNYNLSNHANAFNFGENQVVSALDRWTKDNPNPNAANPITSVGSSFRESDRFVEDGSFVRLKNVRLAYSLPLGAQVSTWVKSLQLYVSGQNLLTFTNYSWYDPEVSTRMTESGRASITMGIDQTSYPVAKTYTVGINVGF